MGLESISEGTEMGKFIEKSRGSEKVGEMNAKWRGFHSRQGATSEPQRGQVTGRPATRNAEMLAQVNNALSVKLFLEIARHLATTNRHWRPLQARASLASASRAIVARFRAEWDPNLHAG